MKIRFIPTAIVLLVFTALLLLTYRNDMASDGYKLVGFPLHFYKNTNAKLIDNSYRAELGFNLKILLFDVIFVLVVIAITNFLWSVFKISTLFSNRNKPI